MGAVMKEPIASQQRLKELGLDKAEYPSCSEPEQRNIIGRGRVWTNQGCDMHGKCPWKDGTLHMLQRDDGVADDVPRPRNVIYKHIIPKQNGVGDVIINRYCACYQFLAVQQPRDGMNKEMVEVVGGEGEEVRIKTSKKITASDGVVSFEPESKIVTVPRFPDPTEVPELFEDVNAGRDRVENKQRMVNEERRRRMGGTDEPIFTKGISGQD